MAHLDDLLDRIAAQGRREPLRPITVIVPSRLAALQLRRRLAQRGAFASVRFEVVSRIAELIAAAELARQGRRPLARPIADYAAALVARESQAPLAAVADLPGYARALRHTFRRLRRAGFRDGADVPLGSDSGHLAEVARLFRRFRELTAGFYDAEDLLEAAAARLRSSPSEVLPELESVYVLPPCRLSAAEAHFLDALRADSSHYEEVQEQPGAPEERFILAPDAASEARLVVREVVRALQEGVRLDEVAVFYSGDHSYRGLFAQAFEAAGIPSAAMPGTPLAELAVGRGTLALARLPLEDYRREAVFEFLGLAPLRPRLPAEQGDLLPRVGQWRRIAREAGVTHGLQRWQDALLLFEEECQAAAAPESDVSEGSRRRAEADLAGARDLRSLIAGLAARLEPLRRRQPARAFIPAFLALLDAYIDPGAEGLAEVRAEVEQLGTIDAIGGEFDLASFAEALAANFAAAALRRVPLGEGVLVADYRLAAGLSFRRVFACGAYEGAFPAAAESEPLLQDDIWSELRRTHSYVDNLERRLQLAREAAARLLAVAQGGRLTWSSPLQAAHATRDYYPSPLMVEAARRRDPSIRSAGDLRRARAREWLLRPPSPLAATLAGPVVDRWEARLREAVLARLAGAGLPGQHPLQAPVRLLRARRSDRFSEYDGNLASLAARLNPPAGAALSPTALEAYASCGFRYFLGSVLRLRGVEEPEEVETIGPAERGTLVHRALERFFQDQRRRGRPAPGERWTAADLDALLAIFDDEYERLRRWGRGGLDLYAELDSSALHADLAAFLEHDSDFRAQTGAVPSAFELRLQPTAVAGVLLSGHVDRLDRSPDGRRAWVIDYKTGSAGDYETAAEDPFAGGTRLQLPVYVLAAAGAEEVQALYWFVSRRADFRQVHYEDTPANRQRFEETLRAILAGLRAGSFPAVPGEENDFYGGFEKCRYCDFDRLCSRRRVYELQAKWEDTSLRPWRRVGETARGEVQT